jgi:hypothetical protein
MPARAPANPPPNLWLRRAAGLLGATGVLVTGLVALLQPPAAMPPGLALTARGAAAGPACALGADGFLRGQFFGALSLTADWSGPGLTCDGMQKPDGAGVRLFFAGDRPGGGRVSLLIGLGGRAGELAGAERPANITVIDEQEGRFFNSGGPGRCWASIGSVTPFPRPAGGIAGSRIDGLVYCVGALPSVGDRASLTLSDLEFSGWIAADGN